MEGVKQHTRVLMVPPIYMCIYEFVLCVHSRIVKFDTSISFVNGTLQLMLSGLNDKFPLLLSKILLEISCFMLMIDVGEWHVCVNFYGMLMFLFCLTSIYLCFNSVLFWPILIERLMRKYMNINYLMNHASIYF